VEFASVNDTVLKGAQIAEGMVLGTMGGDLSLISEQDIHREHQEQKNSGFNLSLSSSGLSGSEGGLNTQNQRGDADYAGVNEQSGIFAGAGGFDLAVGGNTGLAGAVIVSVAKPENNILVTGTLTTEDLYNHSEYEAVTKGLALEFEGTKGSLGPPSP
jgi:filamentous hemagglutinin